jgi:hypothetical protein
MYVILYTCMRKARGIVKEVLEEHREIIKKQTKAAQEKGIGTAPMNIGAQAMICWWEVNDSGMTYVYPLTSEGYTKAVSEIQSRHLGGMPVKPVKKCSAGPGPQVAGIH